MLDFVEFLETEGGLPQNLAGPLEFAFVHVHFSDFREDSCAQPEYVRRLRLFLCALVVVLLERQNRPDRVPRRVDGLELLRQVLQARLVGQRARRVGREVFC